MKILLLLIVVAIIAFMVMRPKEGKQRSTLNKPRSTGRSKSANRTRTNPYSATLISFDDTACDAARALADRVFLDSDRDTPLLPLPNCNAPRCNCRYVHQEDRRDVEEDRRHPSGLQSELYEAGVNENKRQRKRGRRSDDLS